MKWGYVLVLVTNVLLKLDARGLRVVWEEEHIDPKRVGR